MTIGNLSSKIHQMPSMHSVLRDALLPIPIMKGTLPHKRLDEQGLTNREVLNKVRWQVLQSLTFKQNLSAKSRYYNVLCVDDNIRHCKPALTGWLADCPGYSDLHHLERHVCLWCECPKNELADYIAPDKQHPKGDHNVYRTLSNTNTTAANAKLLSRHVHQGFYVCRQILCIGSNLPKPYLLHSMQIGLLDHLQKWIFHFMKTHEGLDMYNAIWLSVPAYHDLTPEY